MTLSKMKRPTAFARKMLVFIDNYQHQDRDNASANGAKADREAANLSHPLMKRLLQDFGHEIKTAEDFASLFQREIMKPENCEARNAAITSVFYQCDDEICSEIEADERHADHLQDSIPAAFVVGRM